MELGTGVFLSAVFLGIVALYIATKDRWNWKKIFLWPLGVIVGVSAIGRAIAYAYEQYEERPKVLTEFKSIKLGEQFQDAIFKHGKAERETTREAERFARYLVEIKDQKGTPKFDAIEVAYKKAKDAEAAVIAKGTTDGNYFLNEARVAIKDNQIESIGHRCSDESVDYTSVNGIRCGAKGDEILEKFGGAVRVLCPKNTTEDTSLVRVYDAAKYGTRYYLTKNSVKQILIAQPAVLDSYVGINWDKCS